MRLYLNEETYIDTSKGIDIAIELSNHEQNPKAWYVDTPVFEPVRANGFIGSVAEGGAVNFRNIFFNPHGHGTHTECVGHISREHFSVNTYLREYWFEATLISIEPKSVQNSDGKLDKVVTLEQVLQLAPFNTDALIIRTLPNLAEKLSKTYSGTNPPYFEAEIADYLVQSGVKHILVDLPSVDREEDGGVLDFHHRFWQYPTNPRMEATITELVYVPNEVKDGQYLLNLQVAPFDNDASPSRPVLFEITHK